MKKIVLFISALCCWAAAGAQEVREDDARWSGIIGTPVPADVRISAQLYQLAVLAREDRAVAVQRLRRADLVHKPGTSTVYVEVVFRNDENIERITDRIDADVLRNRGLAVGKVWRNRATVWLPLEDLLDKTAALGPDYHTFSVTPPRHDNQGPARTGSDTYNGAAPPGGAGRRIGVIDGGFTSLQNSINGGFFKQPAYVSVGGGPTNVAGVNLYGTHGTACAETVYDHAPDADYEIYLCTGTAERGAAVDSCIAHGVNVITMSISEYNLGWHDNTGAACAYAQDAVAAGLLFFTSAGNRANQHYQAVFSDPDADSLHGFSAADEGNNIANTLTTGESVHAYLSWVPDMGTNYDIFIVRASDNAVLAAATAPGTGVGGYERVQWTNADPAPVDVYLRVKRMSGPAVEFKLFSHDVGDYQFATPLGSNTSPSNTTALNVISVGAVDQTNFTDSTGSGGIVMSYSGRGPTNSGNLAPKLCGPTNTGTSVGTFGGTSCATPNAAGAAAAFWSANLYLDATGVRQIIFRKAALYKDFGIAGADNLYGNGGLFLFPWAQNLRYMMRDAENGLTLNATRPYFTLQRAETLASTNSTVIILNNGNYPETALYGVGTIGGMKNILYRYPFSGGVANFGF